MYIKEDNVNFLHTGNQVRHCATWYKETSFLSKQVCRLCLKFYNTPIFIQHKLVEKFKKQ